MKSNLLIGVIVFSIGLIPVCFLLGWTPETTIKENKTGILHWILLIHLIYVLPYLVSATLRNKKGLKQVVRIYSLHCLLAFTLFYTKSKFDSAVWKQSIDDSYYFFGEKPSFSAGYMAEDIFDNHTMVGKTRSEIKKIFGEPTWEQANQFVYGYSNGCFLDGCNKILIRFYGNVCTEMNYSGCD